MTDIFISYAREDGRRIGELVNALEEQGWLIFWDRRIPAGQTWRTYIGKALDEAQCVVVAWTHYSVDSNWVVEEAEDAKRRKVLVPILFESIEQPRGFREIQAADLSDWRPGSPSLAFDQLVYDLRSLLKNASGQVPEKAPAKKAATEAMSRNVALRRMIIIATSLALLGCLFFLSFKFSRPQGGSAEPTSPPIEPMATDTTELKQSTTASQSVLPESQGLETKPTSVTSGSVTVFGGNSRYGESGFNFATKAVVAWNSGQADLLVEESTMANAHFFLQQDTKDPTLSGGLQDKGARSGIQRVEAGNLEMLERCPGSGYQYFRVEAEENAIYCVRTRDGQHFAKIQVISLKADSITFNWQYQASASLAFE